MTNRRVVDTGNERNRNRKGNSKEKGKGNIKEAVKETCQRIKGTEKEMVTETREGTGVSGEEGGEERAAGRVKVAVQKKQGSGGNWRESVRVCVRAGQETVKTRRK